MTPLAKNNLAAPDIRLDYRGSLISGVSFMSISSIVFKKWEEGGGGASSSPGMAKKVQCE